MTLAQWAQLVLDAAEDSAPKQCGDPYNRRGATPEMWATWWERQRIKANNLKVVLDKLLEAWHTLHMTYEFTYSKIEEAVDFAIQNEIDTLVENGYKAADLTMIAAVNFLGIWEFYAEQAGFTKEEFRAELIRQNRLTRY